MATLPLTYAELVGALEQPNGQLIPEGSSFTIGRQQPDKFPDTNVPTGMSQRLRTLTFQDVPPRAEPEAGLYFWSNNPEKAKPEDRFLMAFETTGSSSGVQRDIGINISERDLTERARSLYLFFKPSGQFESDALQYAAVSTATGATPVGLKVDKYANALLAGRSALTDYHGWGGAWAKAQLQSGWFIINLGVLTHPTQIPLITGLLRLKFKVNGYVVLALQRGATPPSGTPVAPLAKCDPPIGSFVVRRNRGVFASRKCVMALNGVVALPSAYRQVSSMSMNEVFYFTQHENEDNGRDIDWVRPTHNMPGDNLIDLPDKTIQNSNPIYDRFTPLQFQGNYQVENTLIMRVLNNFKVPIDVALVAFPLYNDPAGLALYDVSANHATPVGNSAVFRREAMFQGIFVKKFTVPSCSLVDLTRRIEVINGSTGRFYYALVPLVGASSAGSEDPDDPCRSTSASTVTTPPSTMTSYTTSTTDTSVTTTGSTTGTGGTPNTNITPDTGVTPDSGTNSGSGTPVSSGTGTPITMVTNDTPVTPGPG